ncbi:hypothetical protein CEUSTIGMA_g5376.t1 [Chlamydomonas eustigma]|uniref:Uncharacterized protein n=1 Tax=Chlamydomonas eustigma TaxID=1157962 RepID=A0A250X4C8_9CHLO|nr:hypothetical protein CEUSTIGMA_g5376.t1 [Chlamydomonas eustigma]|eukprot:GAX77934.1 hypothetical protein CEUSTIGMA_g5376.t1 [Chlamydomonas eustigma]
MKKAKCLCSGTESLDYYPATTMPVLGWLQPCKFCRSWTSRTLINKTGEESVSVCERCQSKIKSLAVKVVGVAEGSSSQRLEDTYCDDGLSDSRGCSRHWNCEKSGEQLRHPSTVQSSNLELGVTNDSPGGTIRSSPLMCLNKALAGAAAGSIQMPLAFSSSASSAEGSSPLFPSESCIFSQSE